MEKVVHTAETQRAWTIVCDDKCPVVDFLSRLIRSCDKAGFFTFVGRENADEYSRSLMRELVSTPWSLLLIDDEGKRFEGPAAIPFILKHLPSGRLACVLYLIPGTMWLTRKLYMSVSRNRRKIATLAVSSKQEKGQNAA